MADNYCQSSSFIPVPQEKEEKRAIIGREYEMRGFWQHTSGVWLCHAFSPNKEVRV